MDVRDVAKLANLKLSDAEIPLFQKQFTETLDVVADINQLDISLVEPTSQVSGLTNILRPDEIDLSRVIPQAEVLRQAPNSSQGFVVVPYVFE